MNEGEEAGITYFGGGTYPPVQKRLPWEATSLSHHIYVLQAFIMSTSLNKCGQMTATLT